MRERKERKVVALARKSPPFANTAKDGAPSSTLGCGVGAEMQEEDCELLIAESVDGVELGGTRSRIEAGGETDKDGEDERGENEPPGNRREFDGIEILAGEINVGAESDGAAEQPAEEDAEDAAEKAHHAGLKEEKLLDVGVGCAEGFEDADFAAALEDGHDECVDDAEGGDGESETAEDAEEAIEDREKGAEGFGGVEEREGVEAHFFDGGFEGVDLGGRFGADGEGGVGGFAGVGVADDVAEVVDLCGAKGGCGC